jgi:hypothetical protein
MASWVKTEAIRGREADGDIRSGKAQERQSYRVYFDDVDARAADALAAPMIPVWGQQLTPYLLYVSNLRARQDPDDPTVFIVEVTYSTLEISQQTQKPPGATKWNVEISGTSVAVQEAVEKDRSGKLIVNVLNEPISPALTKVLYDEQIVVSYYCDNPDWSALDLCRGKVNDGAVTLTINATTVPDATDAATVATKRVFGSELLKLDSTSWNVVYDATGNKVVQMHLTFVYRADGWAEDVPAMSYFQLDGSGTYTPILMKDTPDGKSDDNNQVSHPYHISGAGHAIFTTSDDVHTDTFLIVEKTPFSILLREIP